GSGGGRVNAAPRATGAPGQLLVPQLNVAVNRSAHDVPVQVPRGSVDGPRSLSSADTCENDSAAPAPQSGVTHHSLPAVTSTAKPRSDWPSNWSVPVKAPIPTELET